MVLEGGLRDRMIHESIGNAITDHLNTLGWFDANREHRDITVITGFPNDTDEVQLNTIAFSVDEAAGEGLEMGSKAETHQTIFFIDMFMEDDAVGWHLSGDVYAFLKKNPIVDVYDYNQAVPPVEFQLDILDVDRRKPSRAVNAWQRHWFSVSLVAEDMRANA